MLQAAELYLNNESSTDYSKFLNEGEDVIEDNGKSVNQDSISLNPFTSLKQEHTLDPPIAGKQSK